VGVYWMFYTGGDFEPVTAPAGLPGVPAGEAVEGLRMRPGLAMSQVSSTLLPWGGCDAAWRAPCCLPVPLSPRQAPGSGWLGARRQVRQRSTLGTLLPPAGRPQLGPH